MSRHAAPAISGHAKTPRRQRSRGQVRWRLQFPASSFQLLFVSSFQFPASSFRLPAPRRSQSIHDRLRVAWPLTCIIDICCISADETTPAGPGAQER
jgi:hypothetical protein